MRRKDIRKRKKGFTLIELMVVIAIIAILAAVAIPQYNAYKKKAKAKGLVEFAHSCASEVVAACMEDNSTDLTALESCSLSNEEANDILGKVTVSFVNSNNQCGGTIEIKATSDQDLGYYGYCNGTDTKGFTCTLKKSN